MNILAKYSSDPKCRSVEVSSQRNRDLADWGGGLSSRGQVFPGGCGRGLDWALGILGPVTAFVPWGKSPLLHREGRERMRWSLEVCSAVPCIAHLPSL